MIPVIREMDEVDIQLDGLEEEVLEENVGVVEEFLPTKRQPMIVPMSNVLR